MKITSVPTGAPPPETEGAIAPEQETQLRAVAQQFEAVFLNQMVGAMRKTIQPNGWIPQSQGEKIYQSMLDSEHAERMAESNQFGLSQLIYEHLLRSSQGR